MRAKVLRRPTAELSVSKLQSRLRRAELRVARIRRSLLNAEVDLSNIDILSTSAEARAAARRVAQGRQVAEEAYRTVRDELGSDAPTLPDCLVDSDTSTSSSESEDGDMRMDVDEISGDENDEDEDEDEDDIPDHPSDFDTDSMT